MSVDPNNVLVSVITVCYNAARLLPMTIESILAQDYDNYEYIIQDGNSSDDTRRIIEEYAPRFEEKGILLRFVSESDGGIYDAMNKAVSISSGTWISFMNAGDCFYSSSVLSYIFSEKTYPSSAIIYGDCAEYEYGRFYLFPKNPDNIRSAMPFSHQSMFARRELLSRYPFRTEYRYSADYDFILNAHDMELHFADVGCVVCITTKDGLSSVNYHEMLKESARIKESHGITPPTEAEAKKTERMLTIKQYVLDHFPVFIKKAIRAVQIKLRHQDFKCEVPPWYFI